MTSRIPPSRRDPEFAPQRAAKVVQSQTPGAGRVAQASPVLSGEVAALLRGKAGGTTVTSTGGAAETGAVSIAVTYSGVGPACQATYRPSLAQEAGTEVYAAAVPLTANRDVTVLITPGPLTFSSVTFALTKVADANGIPLNPTVGDVRIQSGTGLTTVAFPAYTTTADFADNGTFPNEGFRVLAAGWYHVYLSVAWE